MSRFAKGSRFAKLYPRPRAVLDIAKQQAELDESDAQARALGAKPWFLRLENAVHVVRYAAVTLIATGECSVLRHIVNNNPKRTLARNAERRAALACIGAWQEVEHGRFCDRRGFSQPCTGTPCWCGADSVNAKRARFIAAYVSTLKKPQTLKRWYHDARF